MDFAGYFEAQSQASRAFRRIPELPKLPKTLSVNPRPFLGTQGPYSPPMSAAPLAQVVVASDLHDAGQAQGASTFVGLLGLPGSGGLWIKGFQVSSLGVRVLGFRVSG